MDKFLVNVRCEDPSIKKMILSGNGQIIEKGHVLDGKTMCFEAVVNKATLDKIKAVAEVEVQGNIEEIGKQKQELVGKGNRFLNN